VHDLKVVAIVLGVHKIRFLKVVRAPKGKTDIYDNWANCFCVEELRRLYLRAVSSIKDLNKPEYDREYQNYRILNFDDEQHKSTGLYLHLDFAREQSNLYEQSGGNSFYTFALQRDRKQHAEIGVFSRQIYKRLTSKPDEQNNQLLVNSESQFAIFIEKKKDSLKKKLNILVSTPSDADLKSDDNDSQFSF